VIVENCVRTTSLLGDFGINGTRGVKIEILAVVKLREHRDAIWCARIDIRTCRRVGQLRACRMQPRRVDHSYIAIDHAERLNVTTWRYSEYCSLIERTQISLRRQRLRDSGVINGHLAQSVGHVA